MYTIEQLFLDPKVPLLEDFRVDALPPQQTLSRGRESKKDFPFKYNYILLIYFGEEHMQPDMWEAKNRVGFSLSHHLDPRFKLQVSSLVASTFGLVLNYLPGLGRPVLHREGLRPAEPPPA